MKVIAISDVHTPQYLWMLKRKLEILDDDVDLIIGAGDLIYKGASLAINSLASAIVQKFNKFVPFFTCFGNEEYFNIEPKLKELKYPIYLDMDFVSIGNPEWSIFFTRGILAKPTAWQKRYIKNAEQVYENKLIEIRSIIENLRKKTDKIVYVSHYAPTYKTLEGENKESLELLGSEKIEKIILEFDIPLAIHGHSHHSTNPIVNIGKSTIINAAIMVNKFIPIITLEDGVKVEYTG
uniref:Calcineurin-like phosphoesterase domain-containing protein n=1 Tax=Thermodesulfobium narugense TaxID=184064 RepID=A0A7C5KH90_9BACT